VRQPLNVSMAIIIFFIVGLINGVPTDSNRISKVEKGTPAYEAGLKKGDVIYQINNNVIRSNDHLMLLIQVNGDKKMNMIVKRDGKKEAIVVTPKKIKQDGETKYQYGFALQNKIVKGFLPALKYGFTKTFSLIHQMILVIGYLILGKLSVGSLAGPVGIYTVVGESAKAGFLNLVYLVGFLSLNVGFINLLPIPAFDGGRLLFLIIEKIKGSPVNPRVENTIHSIGFVCLMLLMIFITYNDILRLFH
ncbi:MAG: RIP metalloprotease RseP, partial [Firmicutes bacterium]|nr:RIP metalloprotease RseP [Bacillota bacterium]